MGRVGVGWSGLTAAGAGGAGAETGAGTRAGMVAAGSASGGGGGIGVEGGTGVEGVSINSVRSALRTWDALVAEGVPCPDEFSSFWYPNDNCMGVSPLLLSCSFFFSLSVVVALASRSGNKSIFRTLHTGQQYSRDLHVNKPVACPWY